MIRSASTLCKRAFATSFVKQTCPTITRGFSTVISDKVKTEEAQYFRKLDEVRKAELRASFEKLLAEEEVSEKKSEIIELLAEKPEKKTIFEDYRMALPLAFMLTLPAFTNEIIVINAETQLLTVFVMGVATVYTQFGSVIAKSLDDHSDSILKELQEVDEQLLAETKEAIEQNKSLLTLKEDYSQVQELIDELSVAQADVLNYSLEHHYRDEIVHKLDALVTKEAAATATIRHMLVDTVIQDVTTKFSTDKKAKDAALEQALAVLSGGAGAKLGKDVIGNVFQSSIKEQSENFMKRPELQHILDGLQAEVDHIIAPPSVEGKGGNVYVTNPIV